jgi:hypothetical protein
MKEKRDYAEGDKLTVECIDFPQWLKQFEGCYTHIKFNIEGAEFPILKRIIDEDLQGLISYAEIEWHDGRKMPEYEADKQWFWDNITFKWGHWRGI